MLRRLAIAAFLALWPALGQAQLATIAPTPATTDNGDRIATTAWVNSWAASAIPLASGKIWIGSVGGIAVAQTPSGDLTVSNAGAFTLATVNANIGTFGSATQCNTTTANAKGLITAISTATCTPAIGNITGAAAGWATWVATPSSANLRALMTDETGTGAAYFQGGDLGTPSAGVLTNATGAASGLTAGHVTTNANLTGCVTSVGNATSVTAGCINTNTNFPLGIITGSSIPAGTTLFAGTASRDTTSTESIAQVPISAPITLKNFYVTSATAPVGAQTYTMTVRKNAADTAITCTMTGAATTCNDLTHTASFAAGDLIALKVVTSASAAVALNFNSMSTAVTTSP